MEWTADISNDPSKEYQLCIELYEGEQHRGTISRDKSGQLVLKIFPGDGSFEVPCDWLRTIVESAEKDLR